MEPFAQWWNEEWKNLQFDSMADYAETREIAREAFEAGMKAAGCSSVQDFAALRDYVGSSPWLSKQTGVWDPTAPQQSMPLPSVTQPKPTRSTWKNEPREYEWRTDILTGERRLCPVQK